MISLFYYNIRDKEFEINPQRSEQLCILCYTECIISLNMLNTSEFVRLVDPMHMGLSIAYIEGLQVIIVFLLRSFLS